MLIGEDSVQFGHPLIKGAEVILDDHVGISSPEKYPLRSLTRTFESVDEYPCQSHGQSFRHSFDILQRCGNDRFGIDAFELISLCQYVSR